VCTPSSTPQWASASYRCCPLLSRFEYIDCRTCPGMSWPAPFHHQTCPFRCRDLYVRLIHVLDGRTDMDLGWAKESCMVPWANQSSYPKRHRFSRFCTAHGRESILYSGPLLHPSNCPFAWGSKPPSNTWFLGPPKFTSQTASRSVQPFLQGSES